MYKQNSGNGGSMEGIYSLTNKNIIDRVVQKYTQGGFVNNILTYSIGKG